MAISRDHVVWVYRTLLLRDPESEDAIAGAIDRYDNRIDMLLAVMQSEEFKGQYLENDG